MSDDAFKIDSPCDADWDAMPGDNSRRHCDDCNRSVHHISTMSRAEAECLVSSRDKEGRPPCARYGVDAAGEIVFQPILTRPERRFGRFVALAALAAVGAGGAAVAVSGATTTVAPTPVSELPGVGSLTAAAPMDLLQAAVGDAIATAENGYATEQTVAPASETEAQRHARQAVEASVTSAMERAAEALRKASDALIRSKIRRVKRGSPPVIHMAGGIRPSPEVFRPAVSKRHH